MNTVRERIAAEELDQWEEPVTAYLRGAALQFHLSLSGGACESDPVESPTLETFSTLEKTGKRFVSGSAAVRQAIAKRREALRRAATTEQADRCCRTRQTAVARKSTRKKRVKADRRPRQICRCGLCRACTENARWERVYNEKFADVTYYGGLRLSSQSPLADFRTGSRSL